jgi:hypothetical protein
VAGRSAREAWFATDKGLGAPADFETDTWVTYTRDPRESKGTAVVSRGTEVLETIETGLNIPHNYVLWIEPDGNDVWVGTSKGLARAVGIDYFEGLKEPPVETAEGSRESAATAMVQRGTR